MSATSQAVFVFVVNASWQAAVIAIAALVAGRMLRPAARFVLYACAIAACAVVPLFAIRSAAPAAQAQIPSPGVVVPFAVASGIVIAELLVVLAGVISFLLRLARTRTLIRSSRRFGMAGDVALRIACVRTPSTAGVFRPVILMPEYLADSPLLAHAIAHELAHVRRRDYLLNLLLEAISIPLRFHPGVIALRRAAAEAREMSSDDAAAAQHGAIEYAHALVDIAHLAAARRDLALAMADSTSLERRLTALREPLRVSRTAASIVSAIAMFLVVTACRYSVRPAVATNLSGEWTLQREETRFGPSIHYTAFDQRIQQRGDTVTVQQRRQVGPSTRMVAWQVQTDGVRRSIHGVPGAIGSAKWSGGRLALELTSPDHIERGVAFVTGNQLIYDGEVRNSRRAGSYHFVFRRVQ